MIERISQYFINEKIINDEDREVCDYGVFVIGFNLLCMASVFVIGWLLIDLKFSLLYLLFYSPIRMFLGGYHCSTPGRCYLTTISEAIILFMLHGVFGTNEALVISGGLILISIIDYLLQEHYWLYKVILVGLLCLIWLLKANYQMVVTYAFFVNGSSYLFNRLKGVFMSKEA